MAEAVIVSPSGLDMGARPFSIGLKPLDPANWIEPDDLLPAYLAEKDRLLSERRGAVFVEEADTRESQSELLDLLTGHLTQNHPRIWARDGAVMRISCGNATRNVGLENPGDPPLIAAACLVQEDLVIMRKGADGWRLAAGCVCFPSSWTLTEKFARPLQNIHAPIPDFGPGTRMATVINRIFDNLQPKQPVLRHNWSLAGSGELHHPFAESARPHRAAAGGSKFSGSPFESAFLRTERQTLRKLPASGDIIFTIRIRVSPLAEIENHPQRHETAVTLAAWLRGLNEAQLAYKGLAADRDILAEYLESLTSQDG